MDLTNLQNVPSFITKDGSEIRELLAYRNYAIRNQSLAEARVHRGGATQEHYHKITEEIYYITHGAGRIRIEGEVRNVKWATPSRFHPSKNTKSGTPLPKYCDSCAVARRHTSTTTLSSRRIFRRLARGQGTERRALCRAQCFLLPYDRVGLFRR